MKYICLILFIILNITNHNFVYANSSYARITTSYAYLYKTANQTIENNVICYLEETYFVEILLDYDSNFYQVNYNGISGFALKSNLKKVIGTPTKPFPSSKIITIQNKCYLRSSPISNSENIIAVVPENNSDLQYIGKIYGEEVIDYQGNLWYLVDFFGVKGYIYSQYVAKIDSININTETIDEQASISNKKPSPLTNTECAIIITILCIPIIFIIIFMYKNPKISNTKQTNKKIKNPRKIKKVDYDELL